MTSNEGGSGGTASASVTVIAPPTIGKAFGASSIAAGGTTSLTLTITNPAANTVALTGVAVTDTLPSGLVVATPSNLSNTCGGTATANAGSASVSLTGGSIAINASCTVALNVTSTTSGSYTNTTGAVTSTNGGTGGTASAPLTVSAAAATHFTVSAPGSATAGTAFSFTVTALDQFNNTATGYAGAVHFTSSDGAATLPANATLTNGVGTFSATLKTAGSQTITATDTGNAAITGTSNTITVGAAGAATHFTVAVPGSAPPGAAIAVTVTALDPFNNTVTSYPGTVHFTSSDPQATLPADATLMNGVGTFTATVRTPGYRTVTATDTGNGALTGGTTILVNVAMLCCHDLGGEGRADIVWRNASTGDVSPTCQAKCHARCTSEKRYILAGAPPRVHCRRAS